GWSARAIRRGTRSRRPTSWNWPSPAWPKAPPPLPRARARPPCPKADTLGVMVKQLAFAFLLAALAAGPAMADEVYDNPDNPFRLYADSIGRPIDQVVPLSTTDATPKAHHRRQKRAHKRHGFGAAVPVGINGTPIVAAAPVLKRRHGHVKRGRA